MAKEKTMVINGTPVKLNQYGGVADSVGFKVFIYVLMSVIGVILLVPYFMMIMKSFMSPAALLEKGVFYFIPPTLEGGNYSLFVGAISELHYLAPDPLVGVLPGYTGTPIPASISNATLGIDLWTGLIYTGIIALFNIIAVPISATFVAYGFARCQFIGKNALFAFMLSTMMLPAVVTQISLFQFYSVINWHNTIFPLTIPNATGGGAIYIFLARSFIQSLPREVDNAAKIDGAGPIRRYFSITLPLCKPVIIYIMIGVLNSAWGDFYGPLVFMPDVGTEGSATTLALELYMSMVDPQISAPQYTGVKMAAAVLVSLVPTLLFFFFQKQLIEGVAMDGLKG